MSGCSDELQLPLPCTCGRSSTGFCTGLHRLSNEEWDAMVFDEGSQENLSDRLTAQQNL